MFLDRYTPCYSKVFKVASIQAVMGDYTLCFFFFFGIFELYRSVAAAKWVLMDEIALGVIGVWFTLN
ncbi:hypothetical protein L2E82_01921 [Cichorium intybus]|uniref:Uncharacterized protein n=1 Tax=Cichorium intybus TaxID=13427 RepID=A0ACB9H105_CICIN|nr:hypothetical protein L2E82_01921 [Cichorium intybus]